MMKKEMTMYIIYGFGFHGYTCFGIKIDATLLKTVLYVVFVMNEKKP